MIASGVNGRLWHVAAPDGRLAYEDNRQILVGVPLSVARRPNCGFYGLHATTSLYNALCMQQTGIVCLVTISGKIDFNPSYIDMYAAETRTVVASFGRQGTRDLIVDYTEKIIYDRLRGESKNNSDLERLSLVRGGILSLFDTSCHGSSRVFDDGLSDVGREVFDCIRKKPLDSIGITYQLRRCFSIAKHGITSEDAMLIKREEIGINEFAANKAESLVVIHGSSII